MIADRKVNTVGLKRQILKDMLTLSAVGEATSLSSSPQKRPSSHPQNAGTHWGPQSGFPLQRSASAELVPLAALRTDPIVTSPIPIQTDPSKLSGGPGLATSVPTERSSSPPPPPSSSNEAFNRAISLSKKLSGSNIPTHVNDRGDLMLDMTGYKSSEDEALRAELIARKILAEELEGNYDIGALIGADERGNLWIYSSEDAKEAAGHKNGLRNLAPDVVVNDTASDPGYHSDDDTMQDPALSSRHQRTHSDTVQTGLVTPPNNPHNGTCAIGDPHRNYAKTLRLTSDQLRALKLKPGVNTMSFSVNRAMCQAQMYYWTYDVPIVISDIDGTITK